VNENAIETRGLSVYLHERLVLDGITVSITPGTFTAVIGPNGAGKSTLLRALLGLTRPSRGTVRLFGGTPESLDPASVGYVPQLKTLDTTFPARAIDLVVSGLRRRWPWRSGKNEREQAIEALERVGVAHLSGRTLAQLSGGELQRVYLARCLVRQPRLILLDEPAAGMDASAEADMYHILEAYPGQTGATILMVTHDWEGARYHASHVLLLHRRLIAFGPPIEVMHKTQLGEAYGHDLPGHVRYFGEEEDA